MRACLAVLVLTVMVVGQPRSVSAQAGTDRAFIDSVAVDLSHAAAGSLPAESRCIGAEGALNRLCLGMVLARRGEFTASRDAAVAAERLFLRTVEERPRWAMAWYGLGIARLQMARAGLTAKEGPLQPVGVSFEAGAGYALVRALEIDSMLVGAGEALALGPLPREGASRLRERLLMLRRIRDFQPLSPLARLAMVRVEREAGNADTVVAMLEEALAQGADSGVTYLEMARSLYRAGKPGAGRAALLQGAATAVTPFAQARFREAIGWVSTPEEVTQWDTLAPERRAGWLASFWATRDVRDGREDGERLIEHYKRLEFAFESFKIVIPQKGRQRLRSTAMAGDRLVIATGEVATIEGAEQGRNSSSDGFDEQFDALVGANVPFRSFAIQQDAIDDRGAIWIRHGKPDTRLQTSGGTAQEAWMYRRPGEEPLILFFAETDFDGTAGASVLVPTIAGADLQQIGQLCGAGLGMCDELLRYAQTEGPRLTGGISNRRAGAAPVTSARPQTQTMTALREQGLTRIRRAVTTDANPVTFSQQIEPIAQIYGLDVAAGGSPRLVVAFAVPGDKLSYSNPPEAGGRSVYPLRIRVLSADVGTGRRVELDTTRQFATAQPLKAGQFLTGQVELPVVAGRHGATLILTQPDGRGALARLSTVVVPTAGGGLTVSDVVLGREGSGVRWNSGATTVPLNPLNAYLVGESAELYYQVGGQVDGMTYGTRLEFFKAGEEDKPPKLAIAFLGEARAAREEVVRTVALGELAPGRYRLRVTVSGGGASATSTAWLAVNRK